MAVSSSQTNPAEQTSEVLVAVASYFNRVATLVGEIVNDGSDNTTISAQVRSPDQTIMSAGAPQGGS